MGPHARCIPSTERTTGCTGRRCGASFRLPVVRCCRRPRRRTAMPERAEIEAVKAVLLDADLWVRMRMDDMPLPADAAHDIALDVVAALDRVRDARGDDELSDEQLDAMRGREDPRVAAALPAARP